MNLKRSVLIAGLLLGIGGLSAYFSFSKGGIEKTSSQSDSINLALRQAVHHLYKIEGDTSTHIPPVKQLSNHYFSIKVDKVIKYDQLPVILDQALKDYNIPFSYEVTIKDCNENNIIWGYNQISFEHAEIPCVNRDHINTCNLIGFSFTEPIQKDKNYLTYSLFVLAGLGAFIMIKSNNRFIPIEQQSEKTLLQLANTSFEFKNLTVEINNQYKTLTFREAKLLEYFFKHPNQVLSRDDIKAHVWGDEGVIVGRSVDVFVSRLRKILKEDQGLEIKNVHGVGYRLEVK